jgi:hypothetical protein
MQLAALLEAGNKRNKSNRHECNRRQSLPQRPRILRKHPASRHKMLSPFLRPQSHGTRALLSV